MIVLKLIAAFGALVTVCLIAWSGWHGQDEDDGKI
jgi:hypothetical protein